MTTLDDRWPAHYRKHRAYYAEYSRLNRDARTEAARKRREAMTEAERIKHRERRRASDIRQRLVRKIAREWQVSLPEARAMLEAGSFPP